MFLNQFHTVCPKIETEFLGKLGNSNVFSAQKLVVSKKKKVFTEIESDFSAKIGNSNVFSYRITTSTSQLRHPISFGGGCFQFFTKNRPKKQQKRAILHTSQANGGARAPPRPPWLRYCFSVDQTNKVKTKKKGLQFKNFLKFWSSSQNSCDFSRILKCRTKKKTSSSQNFYEIRCESTKIAKIRVINTNLGVLGLDLHFNSPEPVNFFGA